MRGLWRFLTSRWTLSFIGAALLCLLVCFLGPALEFLAGVIVRAVVCVVILLVWAGANFWAHRRRRRADQALAEGVAAVSPGEAARAEEVANLRDKLSTALALLRRASGTRGYLYEQPWYVIIGPPGAGKTTALLNAGLKFPLAAEMGQGAVAGVGGTRLCDWWFTEQAVLIDTAGRYTTQDSDAAVDRAGWEGFLDLLKRTRPRQPLNGVMVAIGAPELAQAPQGERLDHARAIRRRIKELTERLGLRLPIYMLFTKADLLAGFSEYFDDLDRTGRAQVWGRTFDLGADAGAAGQVAGWPASLSGLIGRLNGKLVDRLQAERSPDRRALLAGFPAQLASLESPLGEFLGEAFGGSRLDPAPMLRGVYFTSGTQEGTPIDRLTGALARGFGLDQQRVPSLRPQQGRSYFLAGLLQLVFGEAMLASARPGAARRRTALRLGAFAAIAVVTVALSAGLLAMRAGQLDEAARVSAAITQYERMASGMRLDPIADAELTSVLPLLDAARALPYGAGSPMPGAGLGLSQSRKYAVGTRLVYQQALERVLLPRLILRLEEQMRAKLEQPEYLYEATRVYLMLGGRGPMDHELVRAWEELNWRTAYPDPSMRARLMTHLDSLLAGTMPDITLDWTLVEDARRTFSRVPVEDRVYTRMKSSAVADWTPAAALGASGTQAFYRASGKKLTEGVAGFFTVEGFHEVLANLAEVSRQVAGESWVLGEKSSVDSSGQGFVALQEGVVALYTRDYIRVWDGMLADLQVHPLNGTPEGLNTLYILGSPQSPLRDLLASVRHELELSKVPRAEAAAGGELEKAAGRSGGAGARLASLLGEEGKSAALPGKAVDEHYKALIAYVGSGPGTQLDTAIKLIGDLQQQLAASAGGGAPGIAPSGDAAALLKAEASRAPVPVQRWLGLVVGGSSAVRAGGARAAAKAAFAAPGGPADLCGPAVNGRYPFTRGATQDIPIADFATLFAAGGELDAYFKAQIAPFVDTTGRVWRLRELNGVPAPISGADLAAFQRAAAIRSLFFAGGGASPAVRFTITPEFLDVGARQVTLSLGGTDVTYAHGPLHQTLLVWPGEQGMDRVRLSFDPPGGVLEAKGPWALFQLFDRGTLTQGASPELYELKFTVGARQASFSIRAGSVLNPFAPGVLQGFRCPTLN